MKQSKKKTAEGLLKILDPQQLKSHLINISLFILAYEMFKENVIKYPKVFYNFGLDIKEVNNNEDYKIDVKNLNKKDVFNASCLWFQNSNAIDVNDIKTIEKIRKHRNDIVHELPKYILSLENNVNKELFSKLCLLISKIDKWWIINFEVPINSEFDNKNITENDVDSMSVQVLNLISNIIEGNDNYIHDFREMLKKEIKGT